MTKLKHGAVGIVAGGLLFLGNAGVATAQTTPAQPLDIGTVAEALGLNDQTSRELAPLLMELNAVLEHRQRHWGEGDEIYDEMMATYEKIATTLTPTQMEQFHWLLWNSAPEQWLGRARSRFLNTTGMLPGMYGGYGMMRGGRGFAGRGMPMRGMRGYAGYGGYGYPGMPMRGMRGYGYGYPGMPMRGAPGAGWGVRPGWPFDDDIDQRN